MSLIISQLKKRFAEKTVFDGFSYSFSDNGIYALVGDSGIGKTTLLRMISGLDKEFEGEIIGGGFKNVSFAFQEYRLFPNLTALENVTVPNGMNEETEDSAKRLLISLGFDDNEFTLLPNQLSGGMKQRVSLARAFLKQAPVLLLDEPTKELDSTLKEAIYKLIISESKKRLVILVSHIPEELERLEAVKIPI